MASKLLTTNEVAKALAVSSRVLKEWRSRQCSGLPFVRLGRLVRYLESDVEQFIVKSRVTKEEVQTDVREGNSK